MGDTVCSVIYLADDNLLPHALSTELKTCSPLSRKQPNGFKCSQILMHVLQTLQAKPIIITSNGLVDRDSEERELNINEMSASGKDIECKSNAFR